MFLLGRDPDSLDASAADLMARGASSVGVAFCDLLDPLSFGPALDEASMKMGSVDVAVISAGLFGTQEDLEADRKQTERLLTANFTNTVLLCEELRERMLRAGGGQLVVFSSVAGDRGRKPVGIYGASKAGLSHYLESLDHRYHADGLSVLCVKPGFVKTSMTEGLKPPPFAGDPDQVAIQVARAMAYKRALVYTPSIWRLIMLVIQHLPRFVMRRVGF